MLFSDFIDCVVEKLFRVENCIPLPKKRYSRALRNVGNLPSDPNRSVAKAVGLSTETSLLPHACLLNNTSS